MRSALQSATSDQPDSEAVRCAWVELRLFSFFLVQSLKSSQKAPGGEKKEVLTSQLNLIIVFVLEISRPLALLAFAVLSLSICRLPVAITLLESSTSVSAAASGMHKPRPTCSSFSANYIKAFLCSIECMDFIW